MIASLNHLGAQLLHRLGPLSMELALLGVVGVWAVRVLRSATPALRHVLWLGILVKPLVALTVTSSWTVFTPLMSTLGPAWQPGGTAGLQSVFAVGNAPVSAAPWVASEPRMSWPGVLALLWTAGTVGMLSRVFLGQAAVWRLRRQARMQPGGPVQEALMSARRAMNVSSSIDVGVLSGLHAPVIVGLFRPTILLPAGLARRLAPLELRMLLMHELAHVRRHDNWWLLLQGLVAAPLFFHPVVWLCGHQMRQEAEQACDDLVLWTTGRPAEYAHSLTLVAEYTQHAYHTSRYGSIAMTNISSATESNLARRIRRTLCGGVRRMSARSRVLAAVMLCTAAAVSLPATGMAQRGDDASAVESSDLLEQIRIELIAALERGEITPEQARMRFQAARARIDAASESEKAEQSELRRAVIERAMSIPPEEWTARLEDAIVRAGFDLEQFTARIRQRQEYLRQQEGMQQLDVPEDRSTAVQQSSWGQVKSQFTTED